jgi:N-acetyl-gamma-glutamyl-phosphate reductase
MEKIKVSIIGGAGYGAAEILRQLSDRSDVTIHKISSKDYIGKKIGEVHRSLWGSDIVVEDIPPKECVDGADFVFLAMPHVITAGVAMDIFDEDVRIIDLSGDFRLTNLSDYERDYAPHHPCADRLGTFVYGMPELNSEEIKDAKHVASPGCFATGIALGLLPLASNGDLKSSRIRTVAITGSSGSGVNPIAGTHHPLRVNNLKTYKTLSHQHCSEIVQTLHSAGGEKISLDFIPVSGPLARGILAISQLDMPEGLNIDHVREMYNTYYASNPLVSIMPKGQSAEVVAIAGTARVEISLEARTDEYSGKTTISSVTAIDNLIKGGAGQAIQCFNLMTGKDVNFGYEKAGLWP